jgi:hypothetical protein
MQGPAGATQSPRALVTRLLFFFFSFFFKNFSQSRSFFFWVFVVVVLVLVFGPESHYVTQASF